MVAEPNVAERQSRSRSRSQSSDGKSSAVGETKTEVSTEKRPDQDPSSTSPPTNSDVKTPNVGRVLLIVQLFLVLITGAVLGAYITAHLLESEYQNIVTNLQSDQHKSLLKSQNDYIQCSNHLTLEQRRNEDEITKLRIHTDQNERTFQKRVEEYANETNMAYTATNEGLKKLLDRLKTEVDKHKSDQLQLSEAASRLKIKQENHDVTKSQLVQTMDRLKSEEVRHESTQLRLAQVNKRIQAIRNTMTESTRALEVSRIQRNETETQLQQLRRELEAELDRRDVERAECDELHREMLQCRESLRQALDSPAPDGEHYASLEKEREINKQMTMQLAHVLEESRELERKAQMLVEKEGTITKMKSALKEVERDRDVWRRMGKSLMEKVGIRNRMEVLDQFGPGPHYVKFILGFPSPPANESILIELAPLDLMPHTVHTFLTMMQKRLLVEGTFMLSRDHIIVGGPVDSHNEENNKALEQRMLHAGYFPNGALLFKEYSPEYPHVQYTVGFNQAGGPIFYFNRKDNTELHGSYEREEVGGKEGDPCFGKIVEGIDVLQRIAQLRGGSDDSLESAVYIKDTMVVNSL